MYRLTAARIGSIMVDSASALRTAAAAMVAIHITAFFTSFQKAAPLYSVGHRNAAYQ